MHSLNQLTSSLIAIDIDIKTGGQGMQWLDLFTSLFISVSSFNYSL